MALWRSLKWYNKLKFKLHNKMMVQRARKALQRCFFARNTKIVKND